jgi:putative ABC transport system ATP-binding protein
VLRGRGLYRFFRSDTHEVIALREIDISVAAGEIVALVGASGSGKSTLLSCLGGLDEPDAGFVYVGEERLSYRSEAERCRIRAVHFGIVTLSGSLLHHLTVGENARAQQVMSGKGSATDIARLLAALGIGDSINQLPGMLSGGGVARAGLAAALAGHPKVLLCDEPTAEVDTATEAVVLTQLVAQRESGAAILLATHSPQVAAVADRILVIEDGRVRHA